MSISLARFWYEAGVGTDTTWMAELRIEAEGAAADDADTDELEIEDAPAAYVAAVEGFADFWQAASPLKATSIEFYAGKR